MGLGAGSRALRAELTPAHTRSDGQRGLGPAGPLRASVLMNSTRSSLGKHSPGLCAPSQAVGTFLSSFFPLLFPPSTLAGAADFGSIPSPCATPAAASQRCPEQHSPAAPPARGRAGRGPSQQEEGAQLRPHRPRATCPLHGSADSWRRAGSPSSSAALPHPSARSGFGAPGMNFPGLPEDRVGLSGSPGHPGGRAQRWDEQTQYGGVPQNQCLCRHAMTPRPCCRQPPVVARSWIPPS